MGLWWIGTYGYDDWADVEIVIDEALEKPVTPPAQTGDVNMIVVVALGAMAAMTLAVVTLNKKKFSV
jgi:LPXTG-motif cell wall-anchored protein